jgi:dihydrofolate reductase
MTEKSRKIVYIATSLDGFIARKNGDIDWLEEDPSYDYYPEFIKNVEVILMGAATYEKVMSFGLDWPYPEKGLMCSPIKKSIPKKRTLSSQMKT